MRPTPNKHSSQARPRNSTSSPPLTFTHQDKSSHTCPLSTKYTRCLRIYSKSVPSPKSKQAMFSSYTSVLWIECLMYDKLQISDYKSRKKLQTNPRSRVVPSTQYTSLMKYVWKLRQWCLIWWTLSVRKLWALFDSVPRCICLRYGQYTTILGQSTKRTKQSFSVLISLIGHERVRSLGPNLGVQTRV